MILLVEVVEDKEAWKPAAAWFPARYAASQQSDAGSGSDGGSGGGGSIRSAGREPRKTVTPSCCRGIRHETRPDCMATTCELRAGAGVATPMYRPSTQPRHRRDTATSLDRTSAPGTNSRFAHETA